MDMSTAQKGRLAELYFKVECVKRGIAVSKPVTEGVRYDYVIDECGSLKRVQVKWADGKTSTSSGGIVVSLAKMTKKRSLEACGKRMYAAHEIDMVLAYVPKLERFIAIPPELFAGKANIGFRIAPTLSGQVRGTRMAKDFFW